MGAVSAFDGAAPRGQHLRGVPRVAGSAPGEWGAQYRVTGAGKAQGGDGLKSTAESRARALSIKNSDRFFVYVVEDTSGARSSVWVRGEKCQPEQLPRVEIRQGGVTVEMIPVTGGDENWSMSAAGLLRRHLGGGTVRLVDKDGVPKLTPGIL